MTQEAGVAEFNPHFWPWGWDAKQPRLLHSMIRVKDLDASLRFYTEGIGMKILDRFDIEAGRFSLMFLAFDSYHGGGALELTYNWDQEEPYSHGSGYGHIAIGVPDIAAAVETLKGVGADITNAPRRMMAGAPLLLMLRDPDGYQVELIQTNRES